MNDKDILTAVVTHAKEQGNVCFILTHYVYPSVILLVFLGALLRSLGVISPGQLLAIFVISALITSVAVLEHMAIKIKKYNFRHKHSPRL